jgi:hypothetical protein
MIEFVTFPTNGVFLPLEKQSLGSIFTTIRSIVMQVLCRNARALRVRSRPSHATQVEWAHTFHLKELYCGRYSNFDVFLATFADASCRYILFGETLNVLGNAVKPP